MDSWEKYANRVLGSEVNRDATPGVIDHDDEDSLALAGSTSELTFPILFDSDNLPIFPILDPDSIPLLPICKKIIRKYISAHYRQSSYLHDSAIHSDLLVQSTKSAPTRLLFLGWI
jgi:hypothetical protein